MSTKIPVITIGADPEFCCFTEANRIVYPDRYNQMGCVGSDGGGIAWELRPNFSSDPLKVVSNIHQNFIQMMIKRPVMLSYNIIAGSFVPSHSQPLGGHIHFGNIPQYAVPNCCNWLDQYVGACTLLMEKPADGLARREGGYGYKGDHRINGHGFEYRSPSSWITSPYVSAAVLCLAKVVITEAMMKSTNAKRRVGSLDFKRMRVDNVRSKFDNIWKDITGMSLYQLYKPQIDLIYRLVKNRSTWLTKKSFKHVWGITDVTIIKKARIPNYNLKAIWAPVAEVV